MVSTYDYKLGRDEYERVLHYESLGLGVDVLHPVSEKFHRFSPIPKLTET